jgi:sphingomyelin phosphodiesterase
MRFSNIAALVATVLPILTNGLGLSETTSNALSAYGKRSTVSTILADIEDAATCVACEV